MKTLITSLLLSLALLAQAPQEPTPRPDPHDPDSWTCSRDATDPAHLCLCRGQHENEKCPKPPPPPPVPCTPEEEADGTCTYGAVPEDATCLRYCKKSHCHCTHRCDS